MPHRARRPGERPPPWTPLRGWLQVARSRRRAETASSHSDEISSNSRGLWAHGWPASATVEAEPAAEQEDDDHDNEQEFHGEPSISLSLLVFARGYEDGNPIFVMSGRLSGSPRLGRPRRSGGLDRPHLVTSRQGSNRQSYAPVTLVGAVTLLAGSLTLVMPNRTCRRGRTAASRARGCDRDAGRRRWSGRKCRRMDVAPAETRVGHSRAEGFSSSRPAPDQALLPRRAVAGACPGR